VRLKPRNYLIQVCALNAAQLYFKLMARKNEQQWTKCNEIQKMKSLAEKIMHILIKPCVLFY